jgi:hypothetical protein
MYVILKIEKEILTCCKTKAAPEKQPLNRAAKQN